MMMSTVAMLVLLTATFVLFGAALALGLLLTSQAPCRRR